MNAQPSTTMRVAGLMSGTSADGVDVAVVDLVDGDPRPTVNLLGFTTVDYPDALRREVLRCCGEAALPPEELMQLDVVLGETFAEALQSGCRRLGIDADTLEVVGSHGQTVRHRPGELSFDGRPLGATLQLGQPESIRAAVNCPVVSHFRQADMAMGGQGAPLVPMPDWLMFGHDAESRLLVNIGGIANVTWLPAAGGPDSVLAFDTGPGNMVIDRVVDLLTDGAERYDRGGDRAARGEVENDMVELLMAHPFFDTTPPKSTGRETFGPGAFTDRLVESFFASGEQDDPNRLVATVTALTAHTIHDAAWRFLPGTPDRVLVAGGGVHNQTVMTLLDTLFDNVPVESLAAVGMDPDAREAAAFAVQAWLTMQGRPGNIPAATGATRPVVLGRICP